MENEIQKTSIVCSLCGTSGARLFFRKNECDIYTCVSCASKFVFPIPSVETLYSADYFSGAEDGFGYTDYDTDKQVMRGVFEKYMQLITKLRPVRGRLLDIGAATGYFLAIAQEFDFEVSGVEISDYAAEIGRKKGITMYTGTLDALPENVESYDVVTMLDVIEHVVDPLAELKRVHSILKPQGLLVINTPDVGSLYARLLGKRWHLIVPPEHLYYINRSTMRLLLETSGYRVISISTIGKKFTLSYIFKTLYTWQKLSVWNWLSEHTQGNYFNQVALPVNLFDNMFVIAEKV